ncbi:hypothetical protein TG4357_01420 [Thalassovita gelatinovora]|uniref:Uncharacterized protein n=1 Tax=Thalassovita gelatinovora TaxID=53501 RepID=A0A0P1FVC8_THAGE|nr:DUF1801 domain-containing protein [Thalassovita gelatinovora]QIZ81231.1 DUF1801 domain-containing protein [Thalassovita gelatinovora]CUH64662.1 hypothetical protein TG4357_01420 [Thalassovita gelatinovora]SEP94064.1 protein of unknown function (DU1801) [Thalassovita gelatinovora]
MPDFSDAAVKAAFGAFAPEARRGLIGLRQLIFETAADLPEVGTVEETLRWGQPAYLTPVRKSGSTLRLGVPKSGGFALYAHCQTTIISAFAAAFPGQDRIEGNRAVLFEDASQIDPDRHTLLIRHALTYHLRPVSGGSA